MSKLTSSNEVFGVKIEKNLPESKLTELGVYSWIKWEGSPSIIPNYTFEAQDSTYMVEGKAKVTVHVNEGSEGSFEIGAGDFVVFPKGMTITWETIEAIKKYYTLN